MQTVTSEYESAAPVVANGHATAPAGPRIQRREAWLDLPEEYAGFRVKVWINFPQTLGADIKSGETERVMGALRRIVREHNGWQDEAGNVLPQPSEQSFWDAIPDELAAVVIILVGGESQKLPNALVRRMKER